VEETGMCACVREREGNERERGAILVSVVCGNETGEGRKEGRKAGRQAGRNDRRKEGPAPFATSFW
jgi:hypothetical protein